MNKKYLISGIVVVLVVLVLFWLFGGSYGVVEWDSLDGEDCISKNVCIARKTGGYLYNSVSERSHDVAISPKWTEWSNEECGSSEEFVPMSGVVKGSGRIVKDNYCMHLVKEDVYFNINFTKWSRSSDHFAYIRTPY
jgi:hypothetical protein